MTLYPHALRLLLRGATFSTVQTHDEIRPHESRSSSMSALVLRDAKMIPERLFKLYPSAVSFSLQFKPGCRM